VGKLGEHMDNRIELAKKFIQEQIRKRDDIIGAIVTGSVSRGEAVESSDLDMLIIVSGNVEGNKGGGVDTWKEGVYIDAKIVLGGDFADIEEVLQNPFRATQINDGLILYDPTGFFSQIQKEVRLNFMAPKWVRMRVQFWLKSARKHMSGLQESVEVRDPLGICEHVGGILWAFTSVPLLRLGITPGNASSLVRLGETSGKLKERICEWEGSSKMNVDDILGFLSLILEGVSFMDSSRWGILPTEHVVNKIKWMASNDLPREAFHVLWIGMGVLAQEWRKSEDAWIKSKGSELTQRWLENIGWGEKVVLKEKIRMAEAILKEIEELADNLPSTASTTLI
jgi:predicted nucleotidyltransferase